MTNGAKEGRAVRITFNLPEIFPSDDERSIPLLRLMAATNDARYVVKNTLPLMRKKAGANEFEATIIEGELLYLFRLLCGHLYEAGIAFRHLQSIGNDLLDAVVNNAQEAQKHLAIVRKAYASDRDETFHISFLQPVRNLISFHYKAEPLTTALRNHNTVGEFQGTTIVVTSSGHGRHAICDQLVKGILQEVTGANSEDFATVFYDKMGEVLTLAEALPQLTDHILTYLFDQRKAAIIEDKWGEISIPNDMRI